MLKNQRDIIEDNINNDSKMPYAVKNVLNNPRLKGIHNVLIKLINVDLMCSSDIAFLPLALLLFILINSLII